MKPATNKSGFPGAPEGKLAYDPYAPAVKARRMKLIGSINALDSPEQDEADAALTRILGEMYPNVNFE